MSVRILASLTSIPSSAHETELSKESRYEEGISDSPVSFFVSHTSPSAQVLITLILIGVEVGIVVTMLILEPPKDEPHYPSKDRVILVSSSSNPSFHRNPHVDRRPIHKRYWVFYIYILNFDLPGKHKCYINLEKVALREKVEKRGTGEHSPRPC